jgi:hypothetical protein
MDDQPSAVSRRHPQMRAAAAARSIGRRCGPEKSLTQHIYGMVDQGEQDEQRLTVSGLAHLKAIERTTPSSPLMEQRLLRRPPEMARSV